MAFGSLIDHFEGIRYQVSGNLVVSKSVKSLPQESINVRYFSESIRDFRSGGSRVGGISYDGRLFGQIFLRRSLIVGRKSAGIIFTFQPALASAEGCCSMGVKPQFVFVSWAIKEEIGHTIPKFSIINLVFWRVGMTCLFELTR